LPKLNVLDFWWSFCLQKFVLWIVPSPMHVKIPCYSEMSGVHAHILERMSQDFHGVVLNISESKLYFANEYKL